MKRRGKKTIRSRRYCHIEDGSWLINSTEEKQQQQTENDCLQTRRRIYRNRFFAKAIFSNTEKRTQKRETLNGATKTKYFFRWSPVGFSSSDVVRRPFLHSREMCEQFMSMVFAVYQRNTFSFTHFTQQINEWNTLHSIWWKCYRNWGPSSKSQNEKIIKKMKNTHQGKKLKRSSRNSSNTL